MRSFFKISGVFAIIGLLFYIVTLLFPAYFNPQIHTDSHSTEVVSSPILSAETSEDYVIQTCGSTCRNCNNSGDNCAQFMIEQTRLLCSDGKKGDTICLLDLLDLTDACHKICKAPSEEPKT